MGDRVNECLEDLSDFAANRVRAEVRNQYDKLAPICESQIERLFLIGLLRASMLGHVDIPDPKWWSQGKAEAFVFQPDGMLTYLVQACGFQEKSRIGVAMQVPVSGYRADFILFSVSANPKEKVEFDGFHKEWRTECVVVECDGHDFHEKTKEQAQRDKKRDRRMMISGFQVMRFTGSEIWKDPDKCVYEALRYTATLHRDAWP